MLRVNLGDDILAKQGSMVAFTGDVDFLHEHQGMARNMKRALTGESMHFMRVSGEGTVYFGDGAQPIQLIELDGTMPLSVTGNRILAFDAHLDWDVAMVKGLAKTAGGFFNVELSGVGSVAVTTKGIPVVLDCSQETVFVDRGALVAWSANLEVHLHRSMHLKAMVGLGSGESFQLAFSGPGFVLVQPAEPFKVTGIQT